MQGKFSKNLNKWNKHQPDGIIIIYEDQDIIVINKPSGLLTISTETEKEKTAYFALNEYVRRANSRAGNRIFIVHRLDRDTSGVLIFAKNFNAKKYLQDNWSSFSKRYFAVVQGVLPEKEGVMVSYLAENKANKMYSVVNPNDGKFSKTGYKVIKESTNYSLLEINLFTGTKNQIRVHFSEKGNPVAGDKIYGQTKSHVKRLALHSSSLSITHPFTQKEVTFKAEMPKFFMKIMK